MSTTPNIKSLATQKLEEVVFKSMQIVQSQSYRQVSSGGEAIAYPAPTYDAMYAAILSNATARPMILKKRDEAFRNGLQVAPNFVSKCFLCASEYDFITEECDKCGGKTRKPHPDEEEVLTDVLKIRNANNQNLEDVLKEISVDHDIVDDGWLVSRNIYQERNGEIIDFEMVEFWRIHPGNAAFSMSDAGRIGEYEYTCLYHREFYSNEEFDTCKHVDCGRILHKVVAVRFRDQQVEMRYIKEEIYHGSEYNPTAIYGFPPALTMWYNLVLTSAQEKFMADYYVEKKWPTAAIFVPAKRRETAVAFKDTLDEQTNKDIQARPVFRFDPDAKHKPEVVRLTDTPQEMDFIQVREESRMRMAAFWGISPIFNADVQASGGLNNESQQITVQSWATESKQKSIRQKYLDLIVENRKVIDWHIEFAQLEEEDAAAEVQLDQLRATYAQAMQSLGFKVELDKDGKPTKFSEMPEGSDPFGAMNPMMEEENPIAQMAMHLGGQESVLQQSAKSGEDVNLKTASDAIWDASRRNISEYIDKETANLISGKISQELMEDYALEGIDKLYNENLQKKFLDENKSDYYSFTQKYGDWEWKDKYEFFKFEDIVIEDLNVHSDFEIKKEDVESNSPRVRKETLDYYANETTEMEPFIVDPNYNLLDGHHRLYALEDKNQENLTVAVVLPKHQDIEINTKAEELFEKYIKTKFDKYTVDPNQKRGRPRKHPKPKERKEQIRDELGRFSTEEKISLRQKVQSKIDRIMPKSVQTKKLEKYLVPFKPMHGGYDMKWIDTHLKGNPPLVVNDINYNDVFDEFAQLNMAIFELDGVLKRQNGKNIREKLFVAYHIKKYMSFREEMVEKIEYAVVKYNLKSKRTRSAKEIEITIEAFEKLIEQKGISIDAIDKIIEKLESKVSIKSEFHEEDVNRDVSGKFAIKEESTHKKKEFRNKQVIEDYQKIFPDYFDNVDEFEDYLTSNFYDRLVYEIESGLIPSRESFDRVEWLLDFDTYRDSWGYEYPDGVENEYEFEEYFDTLIERANNGNNEAKKELINDALPGSAGGIYTAEYDKNLDDVVAVAAGVNTNAGSEGAPQGLPYTIYIDGTRMGDNIAGDGVVVDPTKLIAVHGPNGWLTREEIMAIEIKENYIPTIFEETEIHEKDINPNEE